MPRSYHRAVLALAVAIYASAPAVAEVMSDSRRTEVAWEKVRADFSNVRGLNYIASYAPSDVAMWRHYDHDQIDRELGYIRGLGANSIRVWLAWVVHETEGDQFIEKFVDFLDLCEKHRITVMPILWDSCFGDAKASYDDVSDWVANPGTERVADPQFRTKGDRYVRAVVEAGRGSRSLLVWDVMNEPSGPKINSWLEHYSKLIKSLDPDHAVTIGWAHAAGNQVSAEWLDVFSYHPYGIYDKNRHVWTKAVREIAKAHGDKPILVTEAGSPGFGQRYEECIAYFEKEHVGFYLFEAMVGTNRFRDISGFVLPDGSAREIDSSKAFQACAQRHGIEASTSFRQSPLPLPYTKSRAREITDLIFNWDHIELTEKNSVEYRRLLHWTFISLAWGGALGEHLAKAQELNARAEAAAKEGDIETLKTTLSQLAKMAAELLVKHAFVSEDGTPLSYPEEDAVSIDLPSLGPWTNPFSEHPLFKAVVENWAVTGGADGTKPVLSVKTTLKRSTDHPFTLGADWSAALPADEVVLEAQNRGPQRVKIGIVLVSANDRRTTSPFEFLEPGETRQLRFDMLDAKPPVQRGQTTEIQRVEIALRGMRARTPYHVSAHTLQFRHKPQRKPLNLTPIETTGAAGCEVQLAWETMGKSSIDVPVPVELTVEKNERVFLKATTRVVDKDNGTHLEPVSIRLPNGMPGGTYAIYADTRDLPIRGQTPRRAQVGQLTIDAAPRATAIRARVQTHHGAPAIFLDGQPSNGLMYMTYALEEQYLRPFADAGVEIFSFDTCCGYHPYGLTATSWPDRQTFDFSECDAHATRVLSSCPDAKLLIRCYIACPPWWAEANPDECMIAMNAENEAVDYEERPGFRPGSWASERWRNDLGDVLRRFVRHLRNAAYSDRIIGLMVCAGVTEEWMMFGSNTGGVLTDYSAPARKAFRDWVRQRYASEESLRSAWNDPQVTFAGVEPPTPHTIAAVCQDDFADPSGGCQVADWWRFLSDLTADTIEHYSRIVKRESQGDWLCGAFYGYVMQFHRSRLMTAGHLAIDRLTRSPHVDYFFSPSLYSHRSLKPGGYTTFMSTVDSYHVNNKLWCNENDVRTFRVLDVPNVKADQIDRRQTPMETISLLRRQLGAVLARGCGHSYFDMQGGWYDDPRLAQEIQRQVAVADRALKMDRSSASEVAVVVDPDAFTHQALLTQVNSWLILGQLAALGNMGTPFDLITLQDMEKLPKRRLWIFLNLFQPTPEQVAAVHERLRNDGATALFVYASGFMSGSDAMCRLTGMHIMPDSERRIVNITVPGSGTLVARDVTYGTSSPVGPASFGEGTIAPTFHVDDETAAVLGTDSTTKRAALCRKKMDGWTSVYSAAPCVAASVLRALAKDAGVHVYVDEDAVVYANNSLLSVTVVDPGKRTIRLRSPSTVEDGFSNNILARKADAFEVEFAERQSMLFLLKSS